MSNDTEHTAENGLLIEAARMGRRMSKREGMTLPRKPDC